MPSLGEYLRDSCESSVMRHAHADTETVMG
jgi:hypothetical protein